MSPFIATHEITFTPVNGAARTFAVALVEGAAYTRQEWEGETSADWERTDDGRWLCRGQATPGGAVGEVTVRRVKPALTADQIRKALTSITYDLAPSAIDALGGVTDEACDALMEALLEVYPNADATVRRATIDASSMVSEGKIDGGAVCVHRGHFGHRSVACDPARFLVSAEVEASIAADDERVWERACAIAAGE